MDSVTFRKRLARGARLWNQHRWFECHDALEEIWQEIKHEKKREPARDPRRDFVHGLLLLAVAYYHWTRRNPVGLRRKLAEARSLLAPYPARFEGVELGALLEAVQADLARAGEGGAYDAARVPALRVE